MASAVQSRSVRIDRSGDEQVIRIPAEFELPGEEATISQDGQGRLIVEASQQKKLLELLKEMRSWGPLSDADSLPVIEELPQQPVDF